MGAGYTPASSGGMCQLGKVTSESDPLRLNGLAARGVRRPVCLSRPTDPGDALKPPGGRGEKEGKGAPRISVWN